MTVESADLVVVGAGPAGLAAATEVAQREGRAIIIDEGPVPGGRLGGQIHRIPGRSKQEPGNWSIGAHKAEHLVKKALAANVTLLNSFSVWGIFPGWYTGVAPAGPRGGTAQEPAGFESRALLLATGATQNAMVFPGWSLPGIITAGAAQQLINVNKVLPGRRLAMIGIDPINFAVGQILTAEGVAPKGVLIAPKNGLNPGPVVPSEAIHRLAHYAGFTPSTFFNLVSKIGNRLPQPVAAFYPRLGIKHEGIPIMLRRTIVRAHGTDRVEAITIADVDSQGAIQPDTKKRWRVDTVITSAGLSPLTELAQIVGCPLVNLPELGGWVPLHGGFFQTPMAGLFVAGSITGVEGAEIAEAQGRLAGFTAAHYLGLLRTDEFERKIPKLLMGIIKAREISIPFLPGVDIGRFSMQQHWKMYQKRFSPI